MHRKYGMHRFTLGRATDLSLLNLVII
jgi:hypothetical protein